MNAYLQWLRAATGRDRGCPPMGEAALRAHGRGGILDRHHGETGLTALMAPGSLQADLLQLSSQSRSNPEVVAVSFGLEEEVHSDSAVIESLIQAVITWGAGKGRNSAIVDWRHGCQVVLVANVLNVACRYLGAVGPTVRVSASVAYGGRPGGNAALTYTEARESIASGATGAAHRIPNYATRVQWISPDSPAVATATLQFRTGDAAGARIVSQVLTTAATWVAIPNGCDYMRVVNNAGEDITYLLVYELML